MAYNPIGQVYQGMSNDMRNKLGGYLTSLEHRYGDPRVYEQEREQMAAQTAAVMHARARTAEGAMRTAYDDKRAAVRDEHSKKRSRQGTRPESSRAARQARVSEPQQPTPAP